MSISVIRSTTNVNGSADTAITLAFSAGNGVTAGDLLVIWVAAYITGTDRAIVAADVTKTAGNATIGTVAVDKQYSVEDGGSSGKYQRVAIISAPIATTGADGTLTVQVANLPVSTWVAAAGVTLRATGGWDSARLEDSDQATGTGTTPATPSMTSAGGGAFVGCLSWMTSADDTVAVDTTAPVWTAEYLLGTGSASNVVGASYRIVTSGTTDSARYTLNNSRQWLVVGAVYKEVGGATQVQRSGQSVVAVLAHRIAKPASDVAAGSWTATPLYAKVDES